jgi:hypothetical protein
LNIFDHWCIHPGGVDRGDSNTFGSHFLAQNIRVAVKRIFCCNVWSVTDDPLSTVALGSGKTLDSLEILKQVIIV